MTDSLTPQIIAALLGGAVGSVRNFTRAGSSAKLSESLMNALVGEMLAAAAAVQFASEAHIALAAVVGLGAGAVGGYALDALQASVPLGVKNLVAGWTERMGGKKTIDQRDDDGRSSDA